MLKKSMKMHCTGRDVLLISYKALSVLISDRNLRVDNHDTGRKCRQYVSM